MMAGHSLVKILVTSAVGLISSINIWIFPFAVLVSIILLPLIFLELAVAGLQAYVFTILVCVYLNDVINLH
jgi:F0F1-type ATP synthase membrane subunit a